MHMIVVKVVVGYVYIRILHVWSTFHHIVKVLGSSRTE